jgi:hypothetical protein
VNRQDAERLATVHPELAAAFPPVRAAFAVQFPGSWITVGQAFRSPALQAQAHSSGASQFDGVTRFSKHQVWKSEALDWNVYDPLVSGPMGHYVSDGQDARYLWVGRQFEAKGFIWGGSWHHQMPDFDHAERPGPQPTAEQVAASLEAYRRETETLSA